MSNKLLPVPPLSLYVHVPWCIKKCPYCDFNSHTGFATVDEQAYIDALLADLDVDRAYIGERAVDSIFIGGGTPSLLSPESIERILLGVHSRLTVATGCEVTLEANPGSVDSSRFPEFRSAGINRLSIGVQSFDDGLLRRIGRIHDAEAARSAVQAGLAAGFGSINLDLMYALPGQSVDQVLLDVETAVSMHPSHISHYQLTIEPNTLFYVQRPDTPDIDTAWNMQVRCQDALAAAGFHQYEISAYARPGAQCRHNLNYWRFGDYLGIGAGAHGKLTQSTARAVERRVKYKHPKRYLAAAANREFVQSFNVCSDQEVVFDFMLNRCRLLESFSLAAFERCTGQAGEAIASRLQVAEDDGLVSRRGDEISLTSLGRRFLDELLIRFLPDGDENAPHSLGASPAAAALTERQML